MNAQRDAQQASAAGLGRVEFRLLGPLEALVDGKPVQLGPPKQRALLTHLLVNANEAVPVERLIDEIWPEQPPASARHAVQVYVSRLRRELGTPIVARGRSYLLPAAPEALDLGHFRALVDEGRRLVRQEPERAARVLREATGLWRGRALADLGDEPGVRELVLELEELRLEALELRIEADLAVGRSGELVPELERLISEYPSREQLRAQLMVALYRAGRQQEALEAYRDARQALLHELGLEPSPALRELEQAILRHDPSLTVEPPELRVRRHLPAQPNAFIGREREVTELMELLRSRDVRLVTLIGPGGVGKTRLALAAVHQLAASYPDGVWFVDNAPLRDPSLVRDTIARALGARRELQEHLADKRLLIVVDNFEQLLDAALDIANLLTASPTLDVLVTSRERLRLSGEHLYDVPSLSEPEAIALFRARARAARHDFRPGDTETLICRRLDGLPLAIELAAARLADVAASDLLDQLDRRLAALTEGPRDAPSRQQTLRATIEWSHDLLADEERRLFTRLAVFAGGWTAEAAAEVCDAERAVLQALSEKNLVRLEGKRFSMLETVREYALERLDATPAAQALRRRHAEWCAELLEQAFPELREGDQERWLERLEREHNNIRAAFDFVHAAGLDELELRLAGLAGPFWYMQSHLGEGRRRLRHALECADGDLSLRSRALDSEALLAVDQGDFAEAERLTSELLRIAGDVDPHQLAEAFSVRAMALVTGGEWDQAVDFWEKALAVSQETGYVWLARSTLNNLGCCAMMNDDSKRARRLFEEALALEPERDGHVTAVALSNLGCLAAKSGQRDEARFRLRDALALIAELGLRHRPLLAEALTASAWVIVSDRDARSARRLLDAVDRLVAEAEGTLVSVFEPLREDAEARVRALKADSAEEPPSEEPLPLEDAVAFALERLG